MVKYFAKVFIKLALQENLTFKPIFCIQNSVTYVMNYCDDLNFLQNKR